MPGAKYEEAAKRREEISVRPIFTVPWTVLQICQRRRHCRPADFGGQYYRRLIIGLSQHEMASGKLRKFICCFRSVTGWSPKFLRFCSIATAIIVTRVSSAEYGGPYRASGQHFEGLDTSFRCFWHRANARHAEFSVFIAALIAASGAYFVLVGAKKKRNRLKPKKR